MTHPTRTRLTPSDYRAAREAARAAGVPLYQWVRRTYEQAVAAGVTGEEEPLSEAVAVRLPEGATPRRVRAAIRWALAADMERRG